MTQREEPAAFTKRLPILLALFIGSGCAALVYEIVWFQILQLAIGSSAVSLGVLLATFMGGMCLGSLGLARVVSTRRNPLRVYALLEFLIGVVGIGLLYVLPYAGRVYASYAGAGMPGFLFRATVCGVCLLPPTILMGATLPAIARWVEHARQGVSQLGFLYGANIAGAVFGCLLAGFYLLRVYDVVVATYVAAAINAVVAFTALGLAWTSAPRCSPAEPIIAHGTTTTQHRSVYLAIALSGMAALGAEVIWTRILSLMFGATVYTFSIILAVFLIGLGLGSSVGSMVSRTRVRPRVALGFCQLMLTAAIAWSAYVLTRSLPYWPIDVSLTTSPWTSFQLDIVRCLWAVLPAAFLWGASFPLALAAAAASSSGDLGRLVGRVYAANTTGAIIGSLLFSMLIITWLGTQLAQQILIVLAAVAAMLMLAPVMWESPRVSTEDDQRREPDGVMGSVGVLSIVAVAALFVWSVPGVPKGLVAYGRYLPTYTVMPNFLYVGEGMNASVAVTETYDGARNFHVSGKVVASSEPHDMRLQRMLCHIPALLHEEPKSVLVVGCGAGVTAGSFIPHSSIERIVICEIEPLIPPAAATYFSDENYNVMQDPRVEVVYDDARHYIATTKETFDVITSDPIHPWVKGAAALYSKEYFQLCQERLNPGGVVTQWVPLYETNLRSVKSQIATFFQVFSQGTIWSNDIDGKGYDVVLLGQSEAHTINLERLQEKLDQPSASFVQSSLAEVQLGSALQLLTTYAGRASDLREWAKDADINQDRNLRLQFLAGMGVNSDHSELIYRGLVDYRKYPDDLFVANGDNGQALRDLLNAPAASEDRHED